MDEQEKKPKKPLYRYEPGELDKTRKNLGFVEAEEAKKMVGVLGGEIGLEKSAPVDEKAIRRVRSARVAQNLRSGNRAVFRKGDGVDDQSTIIKTTAPASTPTAGTTVRKDILPRLDNKTRNKMEKLMMLPEYGIKTNYGIFNFLNGLRKNGYDRVSDQFASITLEAYISRLKNFHNNVIKLISIAPAPIQEKINRNSAPQYKMLKVIGDWSVPSLDAMCKKLMRNPSSITVSTLVPVTRLMYKFILSVFFLGEQKFVDLLKLVYGEINAYPKAQREMLIALVQGITADWMYVYQRIPRGMYPLLLRMCSNEFYEFSELFTKQLGKVFNFLGITKYDIVLLERPSAETETQSTNTGEKSENTGNGDIKSSDQEEFKGAAMGLKVLDQIFPGAGWLSLETFPDMYPFYQPLYHFQDGVNLISPENPLQITIILVKIIEDLFEGCRHLVFESEKNKSKSRVENVVLPDSLSTIINEWSDYREIVFEKLYLPNLRDFVNNLYAQRDFLKNQYGKRLMSNLQWHIYHNFLPYMKFEQLLLDKPSNESKVRILPTRVSILVDELARVTTAADAAQSEGAEFEEIPNIFAPYKFSLPNVVSQRINVLLGSTRQKQGARATNLNLLKYTYAVASVLDWWINCKTSPAYSGTKIPVCRISAEDGRPIFSVPERDDQNLLFARSIKAHAAKTQDDGGLK
ncbi:MAG: hypothetical protein J6K76_03560 [Spirochaetaceae bacterium]|nr:hypothetical protein [Spirochaetaceae bacterium]